MRADVDEEGWLVEDDGITTNSAVQEAALLAIPTSGGDECGGPHHVG